MGALCLSTAVLRHAPPHVRAPAPRKKPLSAPRVSALRQKTRHCPKPLTFSEMDIIIIKHTKSACLAQPVEHAAVNRSVGGSSPSTGAIERNRIAVSFLFLSFSSNPLTLLYPTENAFGGDPGFIPHKTYVLRGPRFMPHRKYFRWGPRFDAVVFGNGGKRVF